MCHRDCPFLPIHKLLIMAQSSGLWLFPGFRSIVRRLRCALPIRGCARAATSVRHECGHFHEPGLEPEGHPLELSGSAQSQVFKESFSKGHSSLYISRQWTSSPSQWAKIVPSTTSMITRTGTSDSGLIALYHITSHRQRRALRETVCAIQNILAHNWRDLYTRTLLHVYFWRLTFSGISRHAVC